MLLVRERVDNRALARGNSTCAISYVEKVTMSSGPQNPAFSCDLGK